MKPILLDTTKTLTELSNDLTNGLGSLDVTSCLVTEERNGAFVCEMKLPMTATHYSDVLLGSIVRVKPNPYDSVQMFRVYKISKPINGVVTVYANHITYDLNKTSVAPFSAIGCALACVQLKANMTGGSDFQITTNIGNNISKFTNKIPQSFRALLGGQAGSMLDVFGGEYKWNNLTVQLLASRGADRGVEIKYGKNLTDLKQDENIESMYTAVLPFVKASDEADAVIGDMQVIIQARDPRILNLDLTQSFGEGEEITKAAVNAKAQAYIEENDLATPKISLTVSFVNLADTEEYKDLALLEQVRLCDEVTVRFDALGVNAKAKVIKTVYDVLAGRYKSIDLGNSRSSLANTITQIIEEAKEQQAKSSDAIQRAIDNATALITGGLGGYVVLSQNANGQPEEILVMDHPDVEDAVNVIRINKNGIGFSTTGYEGPFANAWTIDGSMVADFITTGTLTANLIRAGILTDVNGKNYWNMETGDFQLMPTTLIGTSGATISSTISGLESYADTKVSTLDNSLNQAEVFKRLTSNGTLPGIYMSGGQLYINASYIQTGELSASRIKGGTLTLGGNNNVNGSLKILNASGTEIGHWNKDGIYILGGRMRQEQYINAEYGAAWLDINSLKISGGYTGYGNTGKMDLQTTLTWNGKHGCVALSDSDGSTYVHADLTLGLFGDELIVGDGNFNHTNSGYTGVLHGIYFYHGIATGAS